MLNKKKKERNRSVVRGWQKEIANQSIICNDLLSHVEKPETELQLWYRVRIKEGTGRCAECGKILNYNNVEVAYGSQAHLLPKNLFPSVKLHPKNCKELGRWCCHGQYDSSWLNASRMKVWPDALDIILTDLVPLLSQKELAKLPEIISNLAHP